MPVEPNSSPRASLWTLQLRRSARAHVSRSRKYIVVSITCALVYNAIMIGLDRLDVHYAVSQALSALVLLPLAYFMQAEITFKAERNWRDFARYSGAAITNYPVAIATLWILCGILRIDMIYASPASTFVLFVWNYFTSVWAFSRRPRREASEGHA